MSRKNLRSLRSSRTTGRRATPKSAENEVQVMTQVGPATRLINPASLRTDGGTQPRTQMQHGLAEEYAGKMRFDARLGQVVDDRDQAWPSLLVFQDETGDLWLADGFHRASAAQAAGITEFQARVEQGSQRDAVLRSLGVNAEHGARRTRADIQRAVERALRDPVWGKYADKWLAKVCRVSAPTVARYRRALEARGTIAFHTILETEDGREIEREAPVEPTPTPRTSARRAPRARSTRPAKTPTWGAPLHGATRLPAIVAHPRTADDFTVLARQAPTAIASDGILVVPCASGDPMLLEGLKALTEGTDAPFRAPHVVYVDDVARMYLVYPRHENTTSWPVRVNTVEELLLGDVPLILGAALHAWT